VTSYQNAEGSKTVSHDGVSNLRAKMHHHPGLSSPTMTMLAGGGLGEPCLLDNIACKLVILYSGNTHTATDVS
jgi:hypothetical protein